MLLLLLLRQMLVPSGILLLLLLVLLLLLCVVWWLLLLVHDVLLHFLQAVTEVDDALFELQLQLQQIWIIWGCLQCLFNLCQALNLLLQLLPQFCFKLCICSAHDTAR